MNAKNVAFKGTMIAGAIAFFGGISILTADEHPFYQEELDDARCKARGLERMIYVQYQDIDDQADKYARAHPIWNEIDSIYDLNAQGVIPYYEADKQIDSLYYKLDSVKQEITDNYVANSQELKDTYASLNKTNQKIEKLAQDSIINDSIRSQPLGQRFKNNWNRIFCQQKRK